MGGGVGEYIWLSTQSDDGTVVTMREMYFKKRLAAVLFSPVKMPLR